MEPIDWKNSVDRELTNHYHFTATTRPAAAVCFLNVVDVHGKDRKDAEIQRKGNVLTVEGWRIECSLDGKGGSFLKVEHPGKGVSLVYDLNREEGVTRIVDRVDGKKVEKVLTDALPELEI